MSGLVARLIAAGTPPELIEEVALLVAKARLDEEAIETRRAKDRERQANRRHVMSRDTADVTNAPPSLDKETLPPTPPIKEINPTPAHTHETRAREAFPRPEWADPQVWSDFLANRRRKSLSNTATAHKRLLADINRLTDVHWPPWRLLEAATARGWGAIYEGLKDDDGRTGQAGGRASRASTGSPTVNAGHRFLARRSGRADGPHACVGS